MIGRTYAGPMDEVTCVRGESFVVSGVDGDVVRGTDQGVYVRDTRFIDQFELLVDGARPQPLVGASTGPATASFHAHVPVPGGGPDPVLLVDRRRVVDGSVHEEVRLRNRGRSDLAIEVGLRIGTDFAYIFDVRHSRVLSPIVGEDVEGGVRFVREDGVDELLVTTTPAPSRRDGDVLVIPFDLPAGTEVGVCVDVEATDVYGTVVPGRRCGALAHPRVPPMASHEEGPFTVRCSDHRFARLVEVSCSDLEALRMADPEAPEDEFCAAGSPWYLTLFGRDSLWTAMMALPHDLELARGTLRTLARRQGSRHDPDTEEEPGKILHEIRRGSLTHRGDLPPNYYGTIDATPLFVVLASEAWRFGLDDASVAALLPAIEGALDWMDASVAGSDRGFLAYQRSGDRGLDNQGWKDSDDGVQFADGTPAEPPVALAEVQGYAHDAAVRGAQLLDHFGRPGGDRWRAWATALADRFRSSFWIDADDAGGPYPVIALDGAGRPVDGPASNMGHLLSSGLLDPDEASLVATRLVGADLDSGWGLRTMSASNRGFNPLSYHAGAIWPHDTAIAVHGLGASGHPAAATTLLRGLVDAAPAFDYRLPELFGGHEREDALVPVPYPAACRPQAWAAGASLLMLRACLGLRGDLPANRLVVEPLWPPPFERLEVHDLPVGGSRLSISVDARAGVGIHVEGRELDVRVVHPGARP